MSNFSSCWLVFDAEKKGSENQCLGLANSLGIKEIILKGIKKSRWLSLMPRRFWFPFLSFKKGLLQDISLQEVPDLIISSGTRASVVSAFIKKKFISIQFQTIDLETKAKLLERTLVYEDNDALKFLKTHNLKEDVYKKKTTVINILNPRLPHKLFDLIITPKHDHLSGNNVLTTLGSLHNVTLKDLQEAVTIFKENNLDLKAPVVSVLIGGPSKSFKMNQNHITTLGRQIAHLHRTLNGSFLVSFSRRTPDTFKKAFLKETKGMLLDIYDPKTDKKPNPYFAYLGLADHLIVTADSISMVTEACSTGKPVNIIHVQKMPKKFQHFHKSLEKLGATKPFKGSLRKWDATPLRENERIAQEVKEVLAE